MRLLSAVAVKRFSKLHLLAFVFVIAVLGTALLLYSKALTPTGYYPSMEKDIKVRVNKFRRTARVNQVKHIDCLHTYAESRAKTVGDYINKVNWNYPKNYDPHISPDAQVRNVRNACGDFGSTTVEIVTAVPTVSAKQAFNAVAVDEAPGGSYGPSGGAHYNALRNRWPDGSKRRLNRVGIGVYVKGESTFMVIVLAKCDTSCSGKWGNAVSYAADPASVTASSSSYYGIDYLTNTPDADFVDDSDYRPVDGNTDSDLAILPLYKYYNAGIIDNLYSMDPNDAAKTSYGYGYYGCEAQIFNIQAVGSVPLYRYFSSGSNGAFGGDSFYTISRNDAGYAYYGFSFVGVTGYVFPSQQPGTVPLKQYFAAAPKSDHFYTTGAWTSGFLDYNYEQNQGYVWSPPADKCGPTDTAPAPANRVPLYHYYNPSLVDNFYTTNWGELGGGSQGYDYHGCTAWVWDRQVPGTVPLYRYYNAIGSDHFYTTARNDAGYAYYGYTYFEGNEGYVFPDGRVGGTLPLKRFFAGGSLTDHFYTQDDWTNGFLGYYFEGNEGYAYNHNSYACPH